MARKQWYNIFLINEEAGFPIHEELVARVKSKGLAFKTLELIKDTYKNTHYQVRMDV